MSSSEETIPYSMEEDVVPPRPETPLAAHPEERQPPPKKEEEGECGTAAAGPNRRGHSLPIPPPPLAPGMGEIIG